MRYPITENGFYSFNISSVYAKMAQCTGTKQDGTQCSHQPKSGQTRCGKHIHQDQTRTVVVCGHMMTSGRACTNPRGDGLEVCVRHHRVIERRRTRENAQVLWRRISDLIWIDRSPEAARHELERAIEFMSIVSPYDEIIADMLEEELEIFDAVVAPLPVNLKGELHALSVDTQNVHTSAVNQQTVDGLTYLLKTELPPDQHTLDEIAQCWSDKSKVRQARVASDMKKWYGTKSCRTENDYLYRRLLDGLWARVKSSQHYGPLLQRLWEECLESAGLCCDGHISRLCNVMVGFDESVKAPVSTGELLQQKLSAISAETIGLYEKVERAWYAMEDLGVPVDDRDAWIEAL